MVKLQDHLITGIKKSSLQINLETKGHLVLAVQKEVIDSDFFENFSNGVIQVAWRNYDDSHPVYLAIFYEDKRVYPK